MGGQLPLSQSLGLFQVAGLCVGCMVNAFKVHRQYGAWFMVQYGTVWSMHSWCMDSMVHAFVVYGQYGTCVHGVWTVWCMLSWCMDSIVHGACFHGV